MKKSVSPVVIGVAAVVLIGLLVVLFRVFFPPLPPPDMANPSAMPSYAKQAKEFLKNRKPGEARPGAMPQGVPAGGSMPGRPTGP